MGRKDENAVGRVVSLDPQSRCCLPSDARQALEISASGGTIHMTLSPFKTVVVFKTASDIERYAALVLKGKEEGISHAEVSEYLYGFHFLVNVDSRGRCAFPVLLRAEADLLEGEVLMTLGSFYVVFQTPESQGTSKERVQSFFMR